MNIIILIIIILIIIILICNISKNYENYDGALLQLYAKGPQDVYLTTNTEKYIPEFRYPYGEYVFNNPTRLFYYYYPLYGSYPRDYYVYPYYWI